MGKDQVLIVDDEPGGLKVISANLRLQGYDVEVALSANEASLKLEEKEFNLMLLDYQMPKMNGLEFLKKIRSQGYQIPVIMITAHSTIQNAVEAMKNGAFNYLTKPLNYDELSILCKQAIDKHKTEKKLKILQQECSEQYSFSNIVGKNFAMRKIYHLIKSIADTDVSVLIQGETGSGKELIARAIHYNSRRRDKGFTVVDCAALSENLIESELFGHEKGAFTSAYARKIGKFEYAEGGTIFLDEIGNINYNVQSKLLRVLERKELQRVGGNETINIDVRIIAATNSDLSSKIQDKTFRKDLFFRLNVIPIYIPPLRERYDDIPLLTQHFVDKFSNKYDKKISEIKPDLLAKLMEYSWPGNVREFENLIERMIVLTKSEVIDASSFISVFSLYNQDSSNDTSIIRSYKEAKKLFEANYLKNALKYCEGNIGATAKITGIQERNLYQKMKTCKLKKEDFKT